VRSAAYPADRIELIYVDTDSTDGSREAAEKLGARVIHLKPERPSAAAARNAGLRAASYGLIHFLDGDTILNPSWPALAVDRICEPGVACVFGRREEVAARSTIFNFWAHHDWYVAPGPTESCAGDALFHRDVLEEAGGFDESLIAGEEPDLCYRIRSRCGMIVLSIDAPMTLHDMSMTRWRQYWRRCVRTGHSYAEVGAMHPHMRRRRFVRWRNLIYALGTPAALVSSAALWSPWPLLVWIAVVVIALARNTIRLRARVGTTGGSLLYALHLFLAKTPLAVGQFVYWYRWALGRGPQKLIEYRTSSRRPTHDSA
jgi:cellulose synthase/poly-beta-1,6-N-acetylglucosamine synthase-like glycosyltransferase